MNGGYIFFLEGWLFDAERFVKLCLLDFVAFVVTADAIDSDAVGDCVKPGL